MKTISVLGLSSWNKKMFTLELSWVLSKENQIYCQINDKDFFNCYAEEGISASSLSNLSIVNNFNDAIYNQGNYDYLVCEEFTEDADFIIMLAEQTAFSFNYLNQFSEKYINKEIIFIYSNFIASNFDDEYFKNYHLDKILMTNIQEEVYLEFDEKLQIQRIESNLNKLINLKKYPKNYKNALFELSKKILKDEEKIRCRDYFKVLDERVSIC